MAFPQLSKDWNVYANVRQSFTTLVGVMGWYAYENKTRMLLNAWTVKFTSNGAVGPSGAGDTTDRITSAATFNVRATVAAAPQSWFVLQNTEGLQILFTYQGASDDVMRISYSPAGLFTLAGTTTHQPTATDEVIMTNITTVINNGASLDRVMSIFCAADSTAWRCALWRNNATISCFSLDKVNRIAPITTLPIPYVFGNFVKFNREIFNDDGVGNVMTPAYPEMIVTPIGSSFRGWGGRVFTVAVSRLCRMYGWNVIASGEAITNSNTIANSAPAQVFNNTFCASMGGTGALVWPIVLWGEKTANLDGPWATAVDWWQMVTTSLNSPAFGTFVPGLDVGDNPVSDPARTNWFVAFGAATIWPWKNAAASLEII
jgi:hypothetical protein